MVHEDRGSMVAVFKNRAFMTLWINQILLQISYNTLNFSLLILVFRLTGSNIFSALFILMAAIPVVILGIFAGVVADRFDKRKILLTTDLGVGIFMFLFIFAQSNVFLILLVAFLLNVIFQFFIPAEAATMPSIVDRRDLMGANALFQFTPTGALLVGSTIAGPIVTHFGYNPVFISGACAMLATFFIRRALPSLPPASHLAFNFEKGGIGILAAQSMVHIKQGFHFISSHKAVWSTIYVLAFMQSAFTAVAALMPGFMEQILKIEATDASLIILLPFGAGITLGVLLVMKLSLKFTTRTLICGGFLICGLAFLLMATVPVIGQIIARREFLMTQIRPFSKAFGISIWVSIFASLAGVGVASVVIPAQTALQKNTSVEFRGRVFALWVVLSSIGVTVVTLAAGVVADVFGVVNSVVVVGLILMTLGTVGFHFEKISGKISPRRLFWQLYR